MISQDYPDIASSEDEDQISPEDTKKAQAQTTNDVNKNPNPTDVFFTDGGHNFSSIPIIEGHERPSEDTLSLANSVEEFDSTEVKKAWDKATRSQDDSKTKPQTLDAEEAKPKFDVAIGGPWCATGQKYTSDDKDSGKIDDKTGDTENVPSENETLEKPEGDHEGQSTQSESPKIDEELKPKFQVAIGGPWWASGQKDDTTNTDRNDVDDAKSDPCSGDTEDEREEGELSEDMDDLPAPPPMSPVYCPPTSPQPESPIDCASPPMRTSTDDDEPSESDEPKFLKKSSRKSSIEDKSSVTQNETVDDEAMSSKGPEVESIPDQGASTSGATCQPSSEPLDIKLEQSEITSGKSIMVKHDPDKVAEDSNPEISAYDLSIQGTVQSFSAIFWSIFHRPFSTIYYHVTWSMYYRVGHREGAKS